MPVIASQQLILPSFVDNINGLIAWWPFNIRSGIDKSVSGYNLTASANTPLLFAGPAPGAPQAASFISSTSRRYTLANIAAFSFGTADFSLCFWIQPTVSWNNTTQGVIGQKVDDSSNGWQIYHDSGDSGPIRARITLQNDLKTVSSLVVGTWTHLVFTRLSGTATWYFNGVSDATSTLSGNISDATAPFYIGFGQTWSAYLNAYMADVRIYNRALTPGEVYDIYAKTFRQVDELDQFPRTTPALTTSSSNYLMVA